MKETKKNPPSGSALFMYVVIAVCAAVCGACFFLYYSGRAQSDSVLWCGITAFTVMYHFWLRIIMGNVTKLFRIHHRQAWFRERAFEKPLYRFLRVKNWKGRALTYNPEAFSLKAHTLEEIADTTAKSEVDHWINEIISLTTLLFAIPWGMLWLFALTAFLAMVFDAQFILIQRYNRPRIVKLMKREIKI